MKTNDCDADAETTATVVRGGGFEAGRREFALHRPPSSIIAEGLEIAAGADLRVLCIARAARNDHRASAPMRRIHRVIESIVAISAIETGHLDVRVRALRRAVVECGVGEALRASTMRRFQCPSTSRGVEYPRPPSRIAYDGTFRHAENRRRIASSMTSIAWNTRKCYPRRTFLVRPRSTAQTSLRFREVASISRTMPSLSPDLERDESVGRCRIVFGAMFVILVLIVFVGCIVIFGSRHRREINTSRRRRMRYRMLPQRMLRYLRMYQM
jgi:hypothetical protein